MAKRPIKQEIVIRFRLALFIMWAIGAAVVYRVFHVQHVQGDKWRAEAAKKGLQPSMRDFAATRGNIYAADGSLLATSLPYYEVSFDPGVSVSKKQRARFEANKDSLYWYLSTYFKDRTAQEYRELIEAARRDTADLRPIKLFKKAIDLRTKKIMSTWPVIRLGRYKSGFVFTAIQARYYPFGGMAQRTIGRYRQNDSSGKAGLEESFNKQLAGTKGHGLFVPIKGGFRPLDDNALIKPQPGQDIHTTLDVNVQDVAESSLETYLRKYRANFGCVIVMETATGFIKAISNLSRRGDSTYVDDLNYAIRYKTDPGSTFKLATLMAVFEEANVSLNDPVETGSGYLRYGNLDIKDDHPIGTTTVQGVIENSSNVGIFKIMRPYFLNRPDKFIAYLDQFRLRQPLHFQIKGEAAPFIKDPSDKTWSKYTLPQMSRGYEMLLTPLQTLAFYNAIANNGYWVQPLLVKEIKIADEVIEDCTQGQIRSETPICKPETLAKLRKMLEGVVERGTASTIKTNQYAIAGKTGTAQKIINGQFVAGKFYTSFVGYFPADKPKYSCIVVVDQPKSAGSEQQLMAAAAAAPVFRAVADKVFANDVTMHKLLVQGKTPLATTAKVHPQDASVLSSLFKSKVVAHSSGTADKAKVPNLQGMSLRDALQVLENKGFKVSHRGKGKVAQQSLPAGSTVLGSRVISLVLQ